MKILTLVALATYIGPYTRGIAVLRGQSVAVNDDVAEKMLVGTELNKEDEPVNHWKEAAEGTVPVHNFSTEALPELPATTPVVLDEKGAPPAPKGQRVVRHKTK